MGQLHSQKHSIQVQELELESTGVFSVPEHMVYAAGIAVRSGSSSEVHSALWVCGIDIINSQRTMTGSV